MGISPARATAILVWTGAMAAEVGAIGFLIGCVGPMIFYPSSNQGPLLGIFLTGPLGVVVGALLGLIIGFFVTRHRK